MLAIAPMFLVESYFLTLFLIGCLLTVQFPLNFLNPEEDLFKDHSPVANGAYSDEE